MKARGLLTILAAAVVGIMSAPSVHAWPGGHSLILFDGDGFETECIDVTHGENVVKLFWTDSAAPLNMALNPEDVARCSISFQLHNEDFGGIYRSRATYVDCTCNRRGTPRYQVAGFAPGTASCSCTATYWGLGLGKTIRTEPLLGVELGDGKTCKSAYAKPVLRPRLLDRWNQDNPAR